MSRALKKLLKLFALMAGSYLGLSLLVQAWGVWESVLLAEWVWTDLLVRTWLFWGRSLPALGLGTLALGFSYRLQSTDFPRGADAQPDIPALLTQVSLASLVLALVVVAQTMVVQPLLESWRSDWADRTRLIRSLESRLDAARARAPEAERVDLILEDRWMPYEEQQEIHQELLRLRPRAPLSEEALATLGRIAEARQAFERFQFLSRRETEAERDPQTNLSAPQLVSQARAHVAREDWESANQRAYLAVKMLRLLPLIQPRLRPAAPPEVAEEAQQILELSFERLRGLRLNPEALERMGYFRGKQQALDAFEAGRWKEAYYRFTALARQNPEDREVPKFRELAQAQLEASTIFLDRAAAAFRSPPQGALRFTKDLGEGRRRFLSFEAWVATDLGVFVQGLEGLTLQGPETVSRWKADWGLVRAGRLHLDFEDRLAPGLGTDPQVLSGTPDWGPDESLDLGLSLRELDLLARRQWAPERLSVLDLWQQGLELRSMGYDSRPAQTELILRLFEGLALLVLSVLMMLVAWSFRSRREGLPLYDFILALAVLPFVLSWGFSTFVWTQTLAVAALLPYLGFWGTVPVWMGLWTAIWIVFLFWARSRLSRDL